MSLYHLPSAFPGGYGRRRKFKSSWGGSVPSNQVLDYMTVGTFRIVYRRLEGRHNRNRDYYRRA